MASIEQKCVILRSKHNFHSCLYFLTGQTPTSCKLSLKVVFLQLIYKSVFSFRKHERDHQQAAMQYALSPNYLAENEIERNRDRKFMPPFSPSPGVYDKCDTGAHCYGAVPQVQCTGTLSRTKVPIYDTRESLPGQMIHTHTYIPSDRDSV